MSSTPILHLAPCPDSFPFQAKYIPLVPNSPVVLGSEAVDSPGGQSVRSASATNGWFAPRPGPTINGSGIAAPPIASLPLSSSHAEVWTQGNLVYIRDLDSAFGTIVNESRIKQATLLRGGDIIALGSKIPRNSNTPGYITEDHLRPILAKVTLVGVPSS
ncbi:hypothetical protein BD779DRAFT_1021974 [Infundibulicybe gibba]|nr:hypothetical protein BD779DRAFT_1021974 [Infundibulicybe gibba]